MSRQYKPLDFDRLVSLAVNKPQVLERFLRFCIYQLIVQADSSQQLSLKQLQFRIDTVRYRSKTHLAACIRISSMMQDELLRLHQAAIRENISPPGKPASTGLSPRGEIISINRAARGK